MHSIDNGYSYERKRDNWMQIVKYLKEINEPGLKLENADILINNENNEVLSFIIKLYQELTKKKVQILEVKKVKTDTDDINKSYLLKETGEIELIKREIETTEKKTEELQKSLSKKSNLKLKNLIQVC